MHATTLKIGFLYYGISIRVHIFYCMKHVKWHWLFLQQKILVLWVYIFFEIENETCSKKYGFFFCQMYLYDPFESNIWISERKERKNLAFHTRVLLLFLKSKTLSVRIEKMDQSKR